ncbi:MAG: SUMF1/EgtB/PvdO family nonheme iron enzyme [Fibrobacteraceae bacterium]|nr:SUMF1/EgtB/PvdO family nonheme iron enzyme [Fibrobacteraceae bacterium]
MRRLFLCWLMMLTFLMWGCSTNATGGDVEYDDGGSDISVRPKSSSSRGNLSSSGDSQDTLPSVDDLLVWIAIDSTRFSRGGVDYFISPFSVATTEVTQKIYQRVMGFLPTQSKKDDVLPVVNVSWYDAVLFCNAYSKYLQLDTVYEYASVGSKNYLKNLSVNYKAVGVRLPTETEWEVAARAGSSDTYYWGTAEASKYAYYAMSSGPSMVAARLPNDFGLYDVAGNVAEWINDWYGVYPTSTVQNYTGPKEGSLRCLRGGGWASKVKELGSAERDKEDPLVAKGTIGFRVVISKGF